MSTGPELPIPCAIRLAQEWQRLSRTAINRAIVLHLRGCADFAMARTPMEALAALHETQAVLLRHSAGAFVQAAELWRRQNGKRAHLHRRPPSAAERQLHGPIP